MAHVMVQSFTLPFATTAGNTTLDAADGEGAPATSIPCRDCLGWLSWSSCVCRKYVCAVRLLQRHAGQIHLYDEGMPETDVDAVVRPAGLTLYGPRYGPGDKGVGRGNCTSATSTSPRNPKQEHKPKP